jgi:Acyl-protein synthetase, LuxE
MIPEPSSFAARLRTLIISEGRVTRGPDPEPRNGDSCNSSFRNEGAFDVLARELFALQFAANGPYRKLCQARGVTPANLRHWTQIPAVPTAAFKEFELTCLAPAERTAVFHSSGTAGQVPSRHFHGAESLPLYEASLWAWFSNHFAPVLGHGPSAVFLTPPPGQAPHSSLVHMFETVRVKMGGPGPSAGFVGRVDAAGQWTLDFEAAMTALSPRTDSASQPLLVLGTAFSFVHLLDFMAENNLRLQLPPGSHVMETGGYKNKSRSLPKAELHALITERLGVPASHIICEYGMSELSSQAYDTPDPGPQAPRRFRFPPWARVQIISPETGREVAEGGTGLVRILDLANVFSVMAIQTEDLGIRRGEGFELLGRAQQAEPRGCSLMTA